MKTNRPHQPPTREEIAARAQELWRIAGEPSNRDPEFWLAAEARIDRERDEIRRAMEEPADDIASAA